MSFENREAAKRVWRRASTKAQRSALMSALMRAGLLVRNRLVYGGVVRAFFSLSSHGYALMGGRSEGPRD